MRLLLCLLAGLIAILAHRWIKLQEEKEPEQPTSIYSLSAVETVSWEDLLKADPSVTYASLATQLDKVC